MLTEYTIRDAFHIPQVPENLLPKSWLIGLSTEQWSILQALTNGDRPLSATELKALIPPCTTNVPRLTVSIINQEQANAWNLSCLLVASYIRRHHPVGHHQLQWSGNKA